MLFLQHRLPITLHQNQPGFTRGGAQAHPGLSGFQEIALGKELIVQNYIEQRTVDLQSTFGSPGIFNETHLPEPVHEETYS
jgi:hypothetical protein